MIDSATFGKISIDGKTYNSDVIIYPDGRVTDSWWRGSGHRLAIEDIQALTKSKPEVIVAGTGVNGRMIPDPEVAPALAKMGIEFLAAPNKDALKLCNHYVKKRKTAGCFHLTC